MQVTLGVIFLLAKSCHAVDYTTDTQIPIGDNDDDINTSRTAQDVSNSVFSRDTVAPGSRDTVAPEGVDTIAPTIGEPVQTLVTNTFILNNAVGMSAADIIAGTSMKALRDGYASYVKHNVVNYFESVFQGGTRRRMQQMILKGNLEYLADSAQIDRIEDIICPTSTEGNCQSAYASFSVVTTTLKSSEANDLSGRVTKVLVSITQDNIASADGGLQQFIQSFDSASALRVIAIPPEIAATTGQDEASLQSTDESKYHKSISIGIISFLCIALSLVGIFAALRIRDRRRESVDRKALDGGEDFSINDGSIASASWKADSMPGLYLMEQPSRLGIWPRDRDPLSPNDSESLVIRSSNLI